MISALDRLQLILASLLVCNQVAWCTAQAPELKMLYPAGGQAGTTQAIEASGKFAAWPVEAWSSCDAIRWSCLPDSGKLQAEIADSVQPGLYWVRFYNTQGASAAKPFLVGSPQHSLEAEPNDKLAEATTVSTLPSTLFGLLNKSADVDWIAVKLQAGQWLSATVDSAEWLNSPADINLQLLDKRGFVLMENLDHFGLDPYLEYQAPTAGDYYLRVFGFPSTPDSTIAFSGGSDWIYRLRLSPHPQPFDVSPDRVPQLNLDSNPIPLEAGKHTSNDQAISLSLPIHASGVISVAKTTDYIRFTARSNTQYRIRLLARSCGSQLDPTIAVLDPAGKQLAQQDDVSQKRDPDLTWKAPADAEYVLAIGDFHRQGGANFRYWLKLEELKPDFTVSLTGDLISAQVGKEIEIAVNLDRQAGYAQPIELRLEGLPEGLASPTAVSQPASDSEKKVVLKLNAKLPFQGPISIVADSAGSTQGPLRRLATAPTQKPVWLSIVP